MRRDKAYMENYMKALDGLLSQAKGVVDNIEKKQKSDSNKGEQLKILW